MTQDFDALALDSQRTQSQAAMERLWAAVYALPTWYFVARPDQLPVQPFVGVVDQQPFLMAFTAKEQADSFARRQGFIDEAGRTTVLALPVQGVVQMAGQYSAQGVFGLLFNNGSAGFFAPMTNLAPMWQFFQARNMAPQ